VTRTATGTPDNYQITKTTEMQTTAERYFAKARLDRKLSDRSFLFGGAGWDRNTFAGVNHRYSFVTGGGRTWFDEETRNLRTDLGLTYTIQDDVVEDPAAENHFAGVRGSYEYSRTLTESTDFGSALVADQNLKETSDFRADWTNSLSVSMSERLALKTAFQILYDKSPALAAVPLGNGEVLTPLGKVDTVFTVAVVANF
jgi:putative salt-induced outer membrane protein YdiY